MARCAVTDVPGVPFCQSKLPLKSEFWPITHTKVNRINLPHAHMGHEEFWDEDIHGRSLATMTSTSWKAAFLRSLLLAWTPGCGVTALRFFLPTELRRAEGTEEMVGHKKLLIPRFGDLRLMSQRTVDMVQS